jgi:hypothetical protein
MEPDLPVSRTGQILIKRIVPCPRSTPLTWHTSAIAGCGRMLISSSAPIGAASCGREIGRITRSRFMSGSSGRTSCVTRLAGGRMRAGRESRRRARVQEAKQLNSAPKVGEPRLPAVRRQVRPHGLRLLRLKRAMRLPAFGSLIQIGGQRRACVKRSKAKSRQRNRKRAKHRRGSRSWRVWVSGLGLTRASQFQRVAPKGTSLRRNAVRLIGLDQKQVVTRAALEIQGRCMMTMLLITKYHRV